MHQVVEYEDYIHGTVFLPDYIQQIIETPQFQRLNRIRQFGLSRKGIRERNYSRYEHSIGTYILADRYLGYLERNTSGLKIPDFYKMVVTIAALLHDIGHGPFSHTWESVCFNYCHEDNARSCVKEIFTTCSLDCIEDHEYSVDIINALILGDPSCLRDQNYRFLFDIVSNKQCNVDVDKWDYLKRDFSFIKDTLNSSVNMDFDEVFFGARVSENRASIEYRFRDLPKIYNMFHARSTFHIEFYRNPFICCLESILKYIVNKSNDNLELIKGNSILDIRSDKMSSFLELYDDKIIEILKRINSPKDIVDLIKCLDEAEIIEIYPSTEKEKGTVPEYLIVERQIPYAGELMKGDKIKLYGDKREMSAFEKKEGYFESVSYFKIMD